MRAGLLYVLLGANMILFEAPLSSWCAHVTQTNKHTQLQLLGVWTDLCVSLVAWPVSILLFVVTVLSP